MGHMSGVPPGVAGGCAILASGLGVALVERLVTVGVIGVGTGMGARDFVLGTGCSGTAAALSFGTGIVVELAAIDDVAPAATVGAPTKVGGVQFCKARRMRSHVRPCDSMPRVRQRVIKSGLSILLRPGISAVASPDGSGAASPEAGAASADSPP